MDTVKLKSEALLVNDLLTQYVNLHNNFLKSAGTFSSLFRKVDFKKLSGDIYLLFERFRDEKTKLEKLQEEKGSERERICKVFISLYWHSYRNSPFIVCFGPCTSGKG